MEDGSGKLAIGCEVVQCYGRLAATVALMARLAHAGDWGRLPELEARCEAVVERLKVIEPLTTLYPPQRQEARRLIERIQRDREQVSGAVKPQLERLMATMTSLYQEKNLVEVYGPRH
jgi:flagellar protein FliT